MYLNLRHLSLLSIVSLTLFGLAGCGEKRVHVSTASGAPGEEIALEPMPQLSDESSETQQTGLGNTSLNESELSSQSPEEEAPSIEPSATTIEPVASTMENEPLNTPGESPELTETTKLEETRHSPLSDSLNSETESSPNADPLTEGQDFSAQSSSSSDDSNPALANVPVFEKPANIETVDTVISPSSQNSQADFEDAFPGEELEPIPDTFQIAKAEPSDSRQDRLNQIKNEELAAAAAGLEDVFFQFDSWTLTQEGKQALNRTLGWFEQAPSSNLIIEGHADQRGTQAYNMVLGKKRAVAVQEYLSQLGVDSSRMAVISYGKDKPFCQEATEVCYQLNRRGHLVIPSR